MKSKAKRKSEDNHNARPLPVEEYAHLVEGLSEADIEAACAQDGAVPGGVPPAWSTRRPMNKSGERLNAPTVSGAPAPLWFEWERAQPCRIVARGEDLAALGIHDGDEFVIDGDAELNEGDLVALEGSQGRLLRRLRYVGGALLLCSGNLERPAIACDSKMLLVGVAKAIQELEAMNVPRTRAV
ncbi:hypothetical protein [Massilia sp. Bi118]|uniref:hypothetical protein n=1 Tax=Massilia sp. Bi118 TaxID=2822346 RepID=UPI001E28DCB7|nr:hypothetical protein [Massilia sp. Bi118]